MRKIDNLTIKTLKNNSAFAATVVSAVIILIGDVIATGTDLVWLIGDMNVQTHAHHYPVFAGLTLALIIMLVSGIWLVKALVQFFSKREAKSTTHFHSVLNYHRIGDKDLIEMQELKDKTENPYYYFDTTD